MSQWVRLPKGAQVTMNRDQVKAMQGGNFMCKALVTVLIIAIVWIFGQSADGSDATPDNKPNPTHSAPRTVGE
jgi:hypothetical protein